MARISRKKGNVNQTGTDVKDIFRTAVYLRLSVEDNGKKTRIHWTTKENFCFPMWLIVRI